jgi:hypothetical protein
MFEKHFQYPIDQFIKKIKLPVLNDLVKKITKTRAGHMAQVVRVPA